MAYTEANFRAAFPAFSSLSAYPPAMVQFWMSLAEKLVANEYKWGTLIDQGRQLIVAHSLAINGPAAPSWQSQAGGARAQPGAINGPVTAGHVDKVGFSRDASAAMIDGAAHWNLSTYGLQYQYLVRQLIGQGPLQAGVPSPAEASMYPGAWPGPYMGGYYGN